MALLILSLVILEAFLFFFNFKPGTFLIGWDNVMPEFNIGLNLERALSSVWQEYRGLGHIDAMSHAANLIHTTNIALLSLFLPDSALRYVFLHLTHLAGGIGFLLLAYKLTKNKYVALLGALFYLFNLGIIQMFYAPLEVFAMHFAALPFLALTITNALEMPTKKHLLLLFLAAILTTPQAFVPTVFVVFLILCSMLFLVSLLTKHNLKRILVVGAVILFANAFWLLPYAYGLPSTAATIQHTKINEFSSEEIYYRNKAHGDLFNVLFMKGFMIDAIEYDIGNQNNLYFMQTWKSHEATLLYRLFAIGSIGVMLIGIYHILQKKRTAAYPYLASFCIAFLFLANNTPVFEQINTLIRFLSPSLGEAFRFPFTKFITLFAFSYALLFCFGLTYLVERLKEYRTQILLVTLICIGFQSYPAFTGYFTSPLLRIEVPQDYFDLFAYTDTLDTNARIAVLPMQTFWNWQYSSWGHRGSGFLWHGIKQPLVLRPFDPWSTSNEELYSELSYAITTRDEMLFNKTLSKYDISYLLLDQYTVNTLSDQPINYESLIGFLDANTSLTKQETFGKLIVYEAKNIQGVSLLSNNTPRIAPVFSFEKQDTLQTTFGNYIEGLESPDVTPLFPSLYTEKLQEDIEFDATMESETITLTSKKPFPATSGTVLSLPSLFDNELLIPVNARVANNMLVLAPIYPKIFINDVQVAITDTQTQRIPLTIENPTSLTFLDSAGEELMLSGNGVNGYLLNKFQNTISVKNSQAEESVFIDTTNIPPATYFINNTQKNITSVKIVLQKIDSSYAVDNIIESKKYEIRPQVRDIFTDKNATASSTLDDDGVTFVAKGMSVDLSFYMKDLYHQGTYLVFAKSRYESGLPVNFYVDNPQQHRAEGETKLSKKKNDNVMVIPKTENYFQGYGFHFIVKSVGSETAKATLENVAVHPFPLETIKRMFLLKDEQISTDAAKLAVPFTKKASFLYTVDLDPTPSPSPILVLSQSYHPGWKAYQVAGDTSQVARSLQMAFPFFFGKEITEHVKVNNWENGWQLNTSAIEQSSNPTIVLVFLPQYLQYLGFLLLIPAFVAIALFARKHRTEAKTQQEQPQLAS